MGLLKIWMFLSGKKTALAAISYAIADILDAAGQPEISTPVRNIAYALTGVGLGHKGMKATSK